MFGHSWSFWILLTVGWLAAMAIEKGIYTRLDRIIELLYAIQHGNR
jgi:hypothetical protein